MGMERSLSNYVWAKAVYDGVVTSDQTSDGKWAALTMDATSPRVLFIIHGIQKGDTCDSLLYWSVSGSNCDSPDFTHYTEISGATHGMVSVADSADATRTGPFMLDIDARKYSAGKLLFSTWSCDAATIEAHVVALGYGGVVNHGLPSSDTVKARA